jgi:hypothetical protein
MSPSRKKARQFLVLLALSGSLLPSCLDGSERSAHLSASAHNNIAAFVEDFPGDKNPPTFYFPLTQEGFFSDPDKQILALLRGISFQEAPSKNFNRPTECVLTYGRLNQENNFMFDLGVSHTCACVGTSRDLGLGSDRLERYYTLDQVDGDALYAAAVTLKAEQESSASKASFSSGASA